MVRKMNSCNLLKLSCFQVHNFYPIFDQSKKHNLDLFCHFHLFWNKIISDIKTHKQILLTKIQFFG